MAVPCGQCGACKYNRRAMWAFRLRQEQHDALNCWFITLTYSDEHLTFNNKGDGYAILVKKDLQRFIKRLRYHHKKTDFYALYAPHYVLRYYAIGEYGELFGRPHYHIIAFNLSPELYSKIHDIWPEGFVTIEPVIGGAIFYVAKFHVNANSDKYDRPEEFATMSRNPGIGAGYLDRIGDWHHRDGLRGFVTSGQFKLPMPRYYKEKLFNDVEKSGLAGKSGLQEEMRYESEVNRLRQLKIENPDLYMFESYFHYASKVKRKSDRDYF